MKSFKQFRLREDSPPANSVGNGGIDGLGVGLKGEPGRRKSLLFKTIARRYRLVDSKLRS